MSTRPLPAAPALGAAGFGAGLVIGLVALAGYAVGGPMAVAGMALVAAVAIVVLLFGAERVLVAAILLNLPLQLDMYLGYRSDAAMLGALGGIPISITTGCLLLLVLRSAVVPTLARSPLKTLPFTAWAPLAIFIGLSALSLVSADDKPLASYGLLLVVQSFLLYVYLTGVLRTAADIRWAVDVLLLGLLVEAGFMMLQRLGLRLRGLLATEVWQSQSGGEAVSRFSGTLGTPNGAAAYLSVVLVLALAVVLSRPDRRRSALAMAALAAGGAGLAVTVSRAGTLAFAAGAVILVGSAAGRRLLRTGPLLVAASAAGLLAAAFGDDLLARFFVDDGGAAAGRVPLMAIALRMIGSSPLTGVGNNNFVVALPEFVTPEFSREWLYVVHNYYLQIASEIGLPGLVAFITFLFFVIRSAWVASKGLPRDLTFLALGAFGALVGRTVHMNLDLASGPAQWESLVILAALSAALLRQSSRHQPVADGGRPWKKGTRSTRTRAASLREPLPHPYRLESWPQPAPSDAEREEEQAPLPATTGIRLRDRYEVGALLGEGRAARVHRAQDLLLGREVAVKMLRDQPEPVERRRVLRAAQAAARVQHHNLIPVHDVEGGQPAFLVLDVVEGRRLADLLRGGLPVERAQVIADGVIAGLAALHEAGLTHREVTAENVLVEVTGTVKLTGAGLAQAVHGAGPGKRSDVYAAGLLLRELLPSPSLSVAAVIRTAVADDPWDRYPNAGVLRVALQEALAVPASTPTTVPATRLPTLDRPAAVRRLSGIALVALFALAAVGVIAFRGEPITLPLRTDSAPEDPRPAVPSIDPEQATSQEGAVAALIASAERDSATLGPAGTTLLDRLRVLSVESGDQRAADLASLYGDAAVAAVRGEVDHAFADAVAGALRPELTPEALVALVARDPEAAGQRGPALLGALRGLVGLAEDQRAEAGLGLRLLAVQWTQRGLLSPSVGVTADAALAGTAPDPMLTTQRTVVVTATEQVTDSGVDVRPGALVSIGGASSRVLFARIGNGEPFVLAADAVFPVATEGRLFLAANDGRTQDGAQSYEVLITVRS